MKWKEIGSGVFAARAASDPTRDIRTLMWWGQGSGGASGEDGGGSGGEVRGEKLQKPRFKLQPLVNANGRESEIPRFNVPSSDKSNLEGGRHPLKF